MISPNVFGLTLHDLGTFGETYPIIENDLLEVIEGRVKKIDQNVLNQKMAQHVKHKVLHPVPLPLGSATENRVFFYDPSFFVENDIRDHKGKIMWKAGTHVNPLEHTSLAAPMLFFDGSDDNHLQWALAENASSRLILTKGSPLQLEEKIERPVFFDQQALLTKKLKIQFIPARVTQEGVVLKIEEIDLSRLKNTEKVKK
ncbi:MAG: type-F conjugative transfer system protein TraW [Alphaproteobacteria bacterium]|nr:type-F conjugative transfer system protein TraW [Alphaproteobacteria bacterium]